MFDLGHIPQGAHVTSYSSRLYSNANEWAAWSRPLGAQFVYILAIGGGGGGGGGRSAAVGTGKGGGGGGGSGAVAHALYLAATLPERVFVNFSGAAGAGGAAENPGQVGQNAYVATFQNTQSQNLVLRGNTGSGGSGSTGTGGGAGGTAGSAVASTDCPLINKALFFSSSAGATGGSGGGTAAPADVTVGTTSPILGGCGGGSYQAAGSTYNGAGYAFNGYIPNLAGGAKDGATAGAGQHGLWLPPYHFGGTGGGGTNDAVSTGGRGGDGVAPGAGGGGGGAGVTGGRGGDGGPAFVLIAAW